jgi:hypothetical protein
MWACKTALLCLNPESNKQMHNSVYFDKLTKVISQIWNRK